LSELDPDPNGRVNAKWKPGFFEKIMLKQGDEITT